MTELIKTMYPKSSGGEKTCTRHRRAKSSVGGGRPTHINKNMVRQYPRSENLRPLLEFMTYNGINASTLADITGETRQNTCCYLRGDDMKISKLEKISSAMKCRLVITLNSDDLEYPVTNEKPDWSEIRTSRGRPRRLAFMEKAMRLRGLNRRGLSDIMGRGYNTVAKWFQVDDCLLSNMLAFAQALDLECSIGFVPYKPKTSDVDKSIRRLCSNPEFRDIIKEILNETH